MTQIANELNDTPNASGRSSVTIAYGDGIGPEIMAATLRVLDAAGAPLNYEPIDIGESVYLRGYTSGIEPSSWESLRRTKAFLKAPITTPQGGGYKSLNVTIRKALGLFANVRPCISYDPFVRALQPKINVVVVRENEEDLYAGVEHRQTDNVFQCLKLITRPGSEKIVRYAFEYARAHGRRKVTCMTKDNIMKLTDGLFHKVFREVGAEYPDLEQDHALVDIGIAHVATKPEAFDVIVTTNLYGDILSNVAAEVSGSIGMAGSSNIGEHCAMFEAIHGTAPGFAGLDQANPSGLILAAVQMLVHLGHVDQAEAVHNAWLRTIEDGIHTFDVVSDSTSGQVVGTKAFTDAVVERLGQEPNTLPKAQYRLMNAKPIKIAAPTVRVPADKEIVGVDLFVSYRGTSDELAEQLVKLNNFGLDLTMITSRGVRVWPEGFEETGRGDHWRCRYQATGPIRPSDIVMLYDLAVQAGIDVIKTENLCTFDGEPGFSLGQGQ